MKKFALKKVYLFFSSLFIFLVHLPFVFAKAKYEEATLPTAMPTQPEVSSTITGSGCLLVTPAKVSVYDSLRLGTLGLAQQAYDNAIRGFNNLVHAGKIANQQVISIIDFSKPSYQKRLFIIDLKNFKILYNTYVAHGANSGREWASHFSNTPESNQSSLGFYETERTYIGKNGYSLHLIGLEKGINDNAYDRDIVMHGADYVSEDNIRSQGFIGRSWGCPAVSQKLSKPIIDRIKNGTCLFIYSPDKQYCSKSRVITG